MVVLQARDEQNQFVAGELLDHLLPDEFHLAFARARAALQLQHFQRMDQARKTDVAVPDYARVLKRHLTQRCLMILAQCAELSGEIAERGLGLEFG